MAVSSVNIKGGGTSLKNAMAQTVQKQKNVTSQNNLTQKKGASEEKAERVDNVSEEKSEGGQKGVQQASKSPILFSGRKVNLFG